MSTLIKEVMEKEYKLEIKPRRLFAEEIEDIISKIPKIKGADKESTESARMSLIETLTQQLMKIEITPLGIPELKNEIINKFERSRIEPGTTVGVLAAEALGGPITQMTLNSFHTSGVQKAVTTGVDKIRELIKVTSNPKNKSCSVYFKERVTYDEIMTQKRGDIVGLNISDVVKDSEVDMVINIMPEYPWWYGLYTNVFETDIITNGYMLRLYIDVNEIYAYNITMEDIANSIEKDDKGKKVVCIYSPMSEGIIDVYPLADEIKAFKQEGSVLNDEMLTLVFISTIIVPNLDKKQIKGINGIKALYPTSANVLQIVEEQIKNENNDNTWFLKYNKIRIDTTGIRPEDLIKLTEACGIEVLTYEKLKETITVEGYNEIAKDFLIVRMPNNAESIANETPLTRIKRLIDNDLKDEDSWEKEEINKGNKYARRPPTPISLYSKIMYAETDGSNLKALLSRDDIDSIHTISNDVNEINRTLGIEAARNFLIREFIQTIQMDGSYVSPRHIVLLVDFMTNQARIVPIAFSGIQRQPTGFLSQASFERSMDVLSSAAGMGKREEIKSTSASIYIGKRARLGTGFTDIRIDQKKLKDFEDKIEKQTIKNDVSEFSNSIDQLENIVFGSTLITPENETDDTVFTQPSIPEISTINTTISDSSITKTLQTYSQPVISNLLQNVSNTINSVPIVPSSSTTISINPIISDLTTNDIPLSEPIIEENVTIQPTIFELPNYSQNAVGLPPSLENNIDSVQDLSLPSLELPSLELPSLELPSTETKKSETTNVVETASLSNFLSKYK